MKLWIDDERNAPPEYTDHACTVEEAIEALESVKLDGEELELVSFDFDAHSHLLWNFTSVAWWMKENDFWPKEIRIHTLNSWVGRPWYEGFFRANAPKTTKVDYTDPWEFLIPGGKPHADEAPLWVFDFGRSLQK